MEKDGYTKLKLDQFQTRITEAETAAAEQAAAEQTNASANATNRGKKRKETAKESKSGKKNTVHKNQQKSYPGQRQFTDLHKNAIKDSYPKYKGFRNTFKRIKAEHAEVFHNRTTSQIRSCWQTMVTKREIER